MDTSETTTLGLRMPVRLVQSADKVLARRQAENPHAMMTRTDVLREAIAIGLRHMEGGQ